MGLLCYYYNIIIIIIVVAILVLWTIGNLKSPQKECVQYMVSSNEIKKKNFFKINLGLPKKYGNRTIRIQDA